MSPSPTGDTSTSDKVRDHLEHDNVRISVKKITANLGRGVGTAEFEKNLRKVLDATNGFRYWVIYLQEIDEADAPNEHKMLRALADEYDYKCVGMESHVPMLISNSLTVREAKVYFGAPGLARLSPNRHWNTALLTPNDLSLSHIFTWWEGCTHFPRWTPVLFSRWRTLRSKMGKIMGERNKRWWFYGMDCNVFGWKKIFPARERTLNKERLDRIQAVEPDSEDHFFVKKINEGVINGTIDGHDFPWVVLQFTGRKTRKPPKAA